MRKKRVLFLSEASYLSTGYATYSRNVLNHLYETDKYELAEISVYGSKDDERRKLIPWKNYPVIPDPKNEEETKHYQSNPTHQFGSWRFERACLDFKPDILLTIRDFWMDSFVYSSPFRRIFSWCWMPTVDASPQNEEWVHQFCDADYILTYSDWAGELLKSQAGVNINFLGSAPPSASEEFKPIGKKQIRSMMNIDPDIKIVGTVMRNQRRKLFPALIQSFSEYIHENNITDTYLYCHTSYPDAGWDLANLFHTHNISSRILMSYICAECKKFHVSKFNDAKKICPLCNKFSCVPSSVSVGLEDQDLNKVYNCFDIYLQIANSEGFGLPQVEAAACGVPIASMNYSAMRDVVKKLNAYPVEPISLYKELETGCDRAVLNKDSLKDILKIFFSQSDQERQIQGMKTRKLFEQHYGWDKTAKVWMDVIDQCELADWDCPAIIKNPPDIPDDNFDISNRDFIRQCAYNYLIDPSRFNSHDIRCLQRDLNNGFHKPAPDGFFSSDISPFIGRNNVPINRSKILDMFKNKLKTSNVWETLRTDPSKLKDEAWLS